MRYEPAFAGSTTFQKVPLVAEPEGLRGADVVIVGAPMDEFVTYRPGARFGPREIRIANDAGAEPKMPHMDLGVDPFAVLRVVDYGDAHVVPGDPAASHEGIRRAVAEIVAAGSVPVILGGDHSIAHPTISAVAAPRPRGTLAVVQFDTHADTATENWGVPRAHGTPFRHLVDEGHLPGDRLVQVGLRGYWPGAPEFDWARAAGVRWHRMDEVERDGIGRVIERVLDEVAGADALFLSVDVDVLDPAFAPGTGTPEPGGMSTRELLYAVRTIACARDLAGMEVVEVSPPYDHASITALAANRVVMEALSGIALRRSGADPRPEDP
jgi:agmatinase